MWDTIGGIFILQAAESAAELVGCRSWTTSLFFFGKLYLETAVSKTPVYFEVAAF